MKEMLADPEKFAAAAAAAAPAAAAATEEKKEEKKVCVELDCLIIRIIINFSPIIAQQISIY